MQLKLNLFKKNSEPITPFTWYIEGGEENNYTDEGYTVYIGRTKDDETGKLETFAIVSGMNFVGQRSNTMFRFMTHRSSDRQFQFGNDVVLPELNEMSLDEIKTFTKHVIEQYQKAMYEWDTDKRCSIFTLNPDPKVAEDRYGSFWGDQYRKAMVAIHGKENYYKMVLANLEKTYSEMN